MQKMSRDSPKFTNVWSLFPCKTKQFAATS